MFASSRRLLARLGRWPRRIAALICLVLAAGSTLVPRRPNSPAPHGVGANLHAGEVAVPVPVASAAGARFVRRGDRVGVFAGPADSDPNGGSALLVADQLRVLSVQASAASLDGAAAVLLVATDRSHALALARYVTRPLLVVIDQIPKIPEEGGAAGQRP